MNDNLHEMSASTQPALSHSLLWLAWLPLVITLAYIVVSEAVRLTTCASLYQGGGRLQNIYPALSAVGFGIIGALIMIRQPCNRIGWLCGAIAVASLLIMVPNDDQ